MWLPWRRAPRPEGEAADFSQVEAAVERMREALVPLNEQLHGLASHISSIRAVLHSAGAAHLPPADRAALEAALAVAEESYDHSLQARDAILSQAQELHSQALQVRARLGALTTREACALAASSAEERIRLELDSLAAATARLQARLELTEP